MRGSSGFRIGSQWVAGDLIWRSTRNFPNRFRSKERLTRQSAYPKTLGNGDEDRASDNTVTTFLDAHTGVLPPLPLAGVLPPLPHDSWGRGPG